MAALNFDGTVKDQNEAAVAGALVYVYDQPGGLAALVDAMGQPAANPVVTDELGYWSTYAEEDRYYTLKIFWGGRLRYVEANVLLGETVLGMQTDPNLRGDLEEPAGSELVGYDATTVKVKIDDWVTPLQKGAAGDGIANDTVYIDAACATGKHVVLPKGARFKSNTKLGHRLISERQIFELAGDIEYDGTQHIIGGGYSGFFALISAVNVHGIEIIGRGRLNGAWDGVKVSTAGKVGSGIFLANCHGALIDGPQVEDFYGEAMKLFNCPENVVRRATTLRHCRNMATEVKSYAANPYIGTLDALAGFLSAAWDGPLQGPSGLFDAHVELIDDNQKGAQNGCGFDFSILEFAPDIPYYDIHGLYRDVLLPIWSENNYPAHKANNIRIKALIQGNIAGVATNECSDGIGLINCHGVTIDADIIDQCNIASPAGAETVGLNILDCTDVEADIRVRNDAGIANKMEHAVKISGSQRVSVRGRVSGVTGISELTAPGNVPSPIILNTVNTPSAENSDIQISVEGGGAAADWTLNYGGANMDYGMPAGLIPLEFALLNVPAGGAASMLNSNGMGFDKRTLPCAGRLVGIVARGSGAMAALNSISVTVSGVAQPLLALDAADFAATGVSAALMVNGADCPQLLPKQTAEVSINTAGGWPATNDVEGILYLDPTWKR